MDRRYLDRVALLVRILPLLESEPRFALKGGTAINLFEHDLPRLSVDIDLAWLPVNDFATDSAAIKAALESLAARLRAPPLQLTVQLSGPADGSVHRLIVRAHSSQVQIETTPVFRGAVHAPRWMDLAEGVERRFGSARMQVLDFRDLYAGKLAAALSRQHPRDLFDVGLLLRSGRLDQDLWRTTLIYLTASQRPAAELLAPGEPPDFAGIFERQFAGMTIEPTDVGRLLQDREWLLDTMATLADEASLAFLASVEAERPDFTLIDRAEAARLPAILHKRRNLAKRSDDKRDADRRQLDGAIASLLARRRPG